MSSAAADEQAALAKYVTKKSADEHARNAIGMTDARHHVRELAR